MNLKHEALAILARSLLRAATHGPATKAVHPPASIAIVNLTTNIGDMICTTPLMRAVKVAYPSARVIVVGIAKNADILQGNPDIDEYLVYDYADFNGTLRRLRALAPAAGVALNPSPHEIGLLYLSGAKIISAFRNPAFTGRAFQTLSKLVVTVPYEVGKYVPREYLKLLEPLGIHSSDTTKHLAVNPAVIAALRDALPPHPIITVAAGAGQNYKQWPPERFAAVAAHAARTCGAALALIGGPNDRKAGEAFMASVAPAKVFDGLGQSIEELKALISLSSLLIANDSGPVYIAEAFGVPTLVIAGVADPVEHPPRSAKNRVIDSPARTITLHSLVSDHDQVDEAAARRQMEAITVERVIKEFDDLTKVIF